MEVNNTHRYFRFNLGFNRLFKKPTISHLLRTHSVAGKSLIAQKKKNMSRSSNGDQYCSRNDADIWQILPIRVLKIPLACTPWGNYGGTEVIGMAHNLNIF